LALSNQSLHYYPQLDAIRALAILLVLVHHWLPNDHFLNFFSNGKIGVDLFFVLSGFLITKILIGGRESISNYATSTSRVLYIFYIRRALRIFPIYYLTIFLAFLLNIEHIRSTLGYFLFYFSNQYFYQAKDWGWAFAPLWSLAVEEQFYLLWPIIILYARQKHLLNWIIAFIILGPVSRYYFSTIDQTFFYRVLAINCIDCFSYGALLAYFHIYGFPNKINKWFLKLTFVLLVSPLWFPITDNPYLKVYHVLFFDSAICIGAMIFIHKATRGIGGLAGKLMENNSILYIGKISYGLYLYHSFVHWAYYKVFSHYNVYDMVIPLINVKFFKLVNSSIFMFSLLFITLLILSSLSWFFIEQPINNLKAKFTYKPSMVKV
jgi:peptidoglycan/LPS O-acetylase OafA/YrhL